ncbi:MAG: starch synthase, partial [Clostridia bacterium]|nr:starch synthase [Clostridia bacterium]
RYGAVPVVRETGGLYDTIRDIGWLDGSGNGFTFAPYSAMELHNALNRAIGCFYNKYEWDKLVKKVMNTDFSWNAAADRYNELYGSLL